MEEEDESYESSTDSEESQASSGDESEQENPYAEGTVPPIHYPPPRFGPPHAISVLELFEMYVWAILMLDFGDDVPSMISRVTDATTRTEKPNATAKPPKKNAVFPSLIVGNSG